MKSSPSIVILQISFHFCSLKSEVDFVHSLTFSSEKKTVKMVDVDDWSVGWEIADSVSRAWS